MNDAAPAIFNGLSEIYPTMKQGKCFFHTKRNIRDRHYADTTAEKKILIDQTSLSKSHSQEYFDCPVLLFIKTYVEHENKSIRDATIFLEKIWLAERNQGWHSGLVPGTLTSNNGLEVINRTFKKTLKVYNIYMLIVSLIDL
jgi:hypothetical protein